MFCTAEARVVVGVGGPVLDLNVHAKKKERGRRNKKSHVSFLFFVCIFEGAIEAKVRCGGAMLNARFARLHVGPDRATVSELGLDPN